RARLEVENDALPPVSIALYGDTAAVPASGGTYDMSRLNEQLIQFQQLYGGSAEVTVSTDYTRWNDLYFTGDGILQLGKAMANAPILPTGGPRILATA
ncbi:MAG: hypothetical protein AAFP86_17730, partial [Planctomycetota bacterium]